MRMGTWHAMSLQLILFCFAVTAPLLTQRASRFGPRSMDRANRLEAQRASEFLMASSIMPAALTPISKRLKATRLMGSRRNAEF